MATVKVAVDFGSASDRKEIGRWEAVFADYDAATRDDGLEGEAGVVVPGSGGVAGFRLSGNNHADDLYMGMRRKVAGLRGVALYTLEYSVRLWTNTGEGCLGVGGSPGDSVYIKVGAASVRPAPEPAGDGQAVWTFPPAVDKGNQAAGGPAGSVAGTAANGQNGPCGNDGDPYTAIEYNGVTHPFTVGSNKYGELWLLVGSDSGFEGNTTIFWERVDVTLRQNTTGTAAAGSSDGVGMNGAAVAVTTIILGFVFGALVYYDKKVRRRHRVGHSHPSAASSSPIAMHGGGTMVGLTGADALAGSPAAAAAGDDDDDPANDSIDL